MNSPSLVPGSHTLRLFFSGPCHVGGAGLQGHPHTGGASIGARYAPRWANSRDVCSGAGVGVFAPAWGCAVRGARRQALRAMWGLWGVFKGKFLCVSGFQRF